MTPAAEALLTMLTTERPIPGTREVPDGLAIPAGPLREWLASKGLEVNNRALGRLYDEWLVIGRRVMRLEKRSVRFVVVPLPIEVSQAPSGRLQRRLRRWEVVSPRRRYGWI